MAAERRTGRWSFPVGRVAGVTIRVHVTFLLLVLLVAVGADASGASVLVEVGWLLGLFACVVVHELAHSLLAIRKGIAVHEIDLLPVGGVSRLEEIPEDWRDEAEIAVVGPLTSVVLGGAALGAAALAGLPLLGSTPWEGPLLVRLGWTNLLLAGFNLVPAFPLDGGRVLRALLERDRPRPAATHQAAQISRWIAGAMLVLGFVANLWLMVLGVVILLAGRAEEAAVLVHAALGPTPARALAVPCPVGLRTDTTVAEALRRAALDPQVAYPVHDAGWQLLGLVTPHALHGAPPAAPAWTLAVHQAVTPETSLEEVGPLVEHGPVAVVEDGRLLGAITHELLAGYLRERLPDLT